MPYEYNEMENILPNNIFILVCIKIFLVNITMLNESIQDELIEKGSFIFYIRSFFMPVVIFLTTIFLNSNIVGS